MLRYVILAIPGWISPALLIAYFQWGQPYAAQDVLLNYALLSPAILFFGFSAVAYNRICKSFDPARGLVLWGIFWFPIMGVFVLSALISLLFGRN
jgi:hypothetical protein